MLIFLAEYIRPSSENGSQSLASEWWGLNQILCVSLLGQFSINWLGFSSVRKRNKARSSHQIVFSYNSVPTFQLFMYNSRNFAPHILKMCQVDFIGSSIIINFSKLNQAYWFTWIVNSSIWFSFQHGLEKKFLILWIIFLSDVLFFSQPLTESRLRFEDLIICNL